MKTTAQLGACALTLSILLGAGASSSHATNIADLPLKASVLAKPNIVYGIDDSGSMDWELLLNTASGIMWSSDTASPGWDSATGKPRFTGSGSESFSYLFPVGWILAAKPVGDAPGGNIYGSSETYFRVVPPTPQFAWLRSAAFNPQYYDPSITYKPWAPAYFGGSLQTFANSPPAAAKIHPTEPGAPTFNLTQQWNATNAGGKWADTASTGGGGYRFRVLPGMKVPSGSRLRASSATSGACSSGKGSSETDITADLTVASGNDCFASIAYFPATYWHAEACTADGINCVSIPKTATTLRRYEIKGTGVGRAQGDITPFPSGRSYADELQNFANWFTYYRKRKLSLAGSMGGVLENLTGVRMGTMLFTNAAKASPPSIVMYDADDTAPASNRLRTLGDFYRLTPDSAGTPTHKTMQVIGDQFDSNTGIVQYACQRNAMFVVTDGFANAPSGVTVPTYSKATFGANAPHATTQNGSLADLGLAYYTKRLRASGGAALAAGRVPPSISTAPNADKNPDLHVNTYAISLGVEGSIWPALTDPFANPPTWPAPVYDSPDMLDDLWHATINGRGLMFLANNPTSTVNGLRAVINDILSQTGAQGGIAVSTVNLPRGDNKAYFGTYNPAGWAGDLTANPIDPATGSVNTTAIWSAGALLAARDWTTRVIASSNGSSGMAFTAANVGADLNPGAKYGSNAAVVDYLRGDRSGEGTSFRTRTSLMGAVINSEPVVARDDGVVYVASGEGMLHAFDISAGSAGQELWAFVPSRVLPTMGESVERGYTFGTKLDGSPVLGKFSASGKLLVAGMGVAGRGYYALDVSNPRGLSEAGLASKLKWEFPAAGDATTQAKVGQTLGRPVIVKSQNDGYVVLLTSGHNNTHDGKGRLWMLNAATGAVIKEFTTAGGTLTDQAGLAHVSAFGESDGSVRYAYGGDLLGNVWSFDLSDPSATPTPNKVAVLTGPAGDAQPVTAAPELLLVGGKRVIMIGTGRLLDITDFGSSKVQSIYAIADGATTMSTPRSTLAKQTYVRGATPAQDKLTGPDVDWATHRGWYIDLPAGEQINTRPTIAYGGLAFVSNLNGGTDCTAKSYLYVVNALSGKKFDGTAFIGTVVSDSSNSSGVTALLTTGQKIVGAGQDADGKPWERQIIGGAPILPGKNAWIEIRR